MRATSFGLAFLLSACATSTSTSTSSLAPPHATGHVSVRIVERGADAPLPCRVHLRDSSGKPVLIPGAPAWRDHFVFGGEARWKLAPGRYEYEIERGPEYAPRRDTLTVPASGTARLHATLTRIVDLPARGWYAGDLHIHRPVADIELLARAEDLHIAPVITWWNDRTKPRDLWTKAGYPDRTVRRFDGNRFTQVMAGEDERDGGALLYFGLDRPLDTKGATAEHPDPLQFAQHAHRAKPGVWIDIEKPFWWDAPIQVASGLVDSIGIANNHMCRGGMYVSEAWGRPRDTRRLPPPLGNGHWTQEIYYKLLNCGVRLPPSAGSASGVLRNPVGYNRVYVKVDGQLTWDTWWAGLRAGRCFVTNGPLLDVTADGKLPGTVFRSANDPLTIQVASHVRSKDPIDRVEIVQNGEVVARIPTSGTHVLTFERSGWFLVRAFAKNDRTFRFGSTAPFYVEVGGLRPYDRAAAKFFFDWVAERAANSKVTDPRAREEVKVWHDHALRFWRARMEPPRRGESPQPTAPAPRIRRSHRHGQSRTPRQKK